MEQIAKVAIDAGEDVVMGHGLHQPLPIGFHAGSIFYGLGSFSFHMGHLGMAHGNWIGLLASIDLQGNNGWSGGESEISFRFVRHNDNNETYLYHQDDEEQTVKLMQKASEKYGAQLLVIGDSVCARPLRR